MSGDSSQLSDSHPQFSLPNGSSFPDCADVWNEWHENNLDADLQVHILTGVYGSKITPNSLRRVLTSFKIDHEGANSIGQLYRRLKSLIIALRRGKKAKSSQEQEHATRETHCETLDQIYRMWPQLAPQFLWKTSASPRFESKQLFARTVNTPERRMPSCSGRRVLQQSLIRRIPGEVERPVAMIGFVGPNRGVVQNECTNRELRKRGATFIQCNTARAEIASL
ncbi:hypothetical protein DFH08DRAFT_821479 [Mycena albidolilacea]|uniref:Uncharacterized protein n=1 Tax=Mycena albidolilacea TaxID=1033008 RepID=A0AAD6ZAW3_9AGAR|nr:hypothetical protein DFH08DRAFT_821479 [Mycena albidolilacea]